MFPTKRSLPHSGAVLILPIIWSLAAVAALPNYLWRHLDTHQLPFPSMPSVSFCYEKWPNPQGRGFYSGFVLFVQFLLPLVTVSFAYFQVCRRVKSRVGKEKEKRHCLRREMKSRRMDGTLKDGNKNNRKLKNAGDTIILPDHERVHRTIALLRCISLIYSFSWLPLNLFNIVVDFIEPDEEAHINKASQMMWYAFCHILGMSSACSNPILYGWYNNNFRREFLKYSTFLRLLVQLFPCDIFCSSPNRESELSMRTKRIRRARSIGNSSRVQEDRDTEFVSLDSRFKGKKSSLKGLQPHDVEENEEPNIEVIDREITAISSNGGYTTTVL